MFGISVEEVTGWLVRHTGLYWPRGDQHKLWEAAQLHRTYAEALRDIGSCANRGACQVTDCNSGAAISAFDTHWKLYYAGASAGAVPAMADMHTKYANAFQKYGDGVAKVKHEITHQVEMFIVALGVGAVVAAMTGPVGALVEEGAFVALSEAVAAIRSVFAVEALTIVQAEGIATVVSAGGQGALVGLLTNEFTQSMDHVLGHRPTYKTEEIKTAAEGGFIGGLAGVALGFGARGLATYSERAAVGEVRPELAAAMQVAPTALVETISGRLVNNALTGTAVAAATKGEIDPDKILEDAVKKELKRGGLKPRFVEHDGGNSVERELRQQQAQREGK